MAKSRSETKIVVGCTPWLDRAMHAWAEEQPGTRLIPVPLTQDDSYRFDFSSLAEHQSADATAFVAWDDQFLNLRRYELYLQLKKMGFALPALIHPRALIDAHVTIPEQSWIDQGAQIASGVTLGVNCYVGCGAAIASGARLGENVIIGDKSLVGDACELGAFVTVGTNATIDSRTKIGRFSRLLRPQRYRDFYAEGTFIEDRFEAEIIS